MTWVAWRTQRGQLAGVLSVGALLSLWLVATGIPMGHAQSWKYWTAGDVYVLMAVPAVLGLGVGAPLVAGETDRSTQRLAWTQTVSRGRWLRWKVGVGAATVAAAGGLLALLTPWWASAVSVPASTQAGALLSGAKTAPFAFDVTGAVIVGYALFAFAVGTALGAVIRRPGWAFAAGVPVFVAARLFVQDDLRPHLVAPAVVTNLTGVVPTAFSGAWLVDAGVVPADRLSPLPGHAWTSASPALNACASKIKGTATAAAIGRCMTAHHLHWVFLVQPESHYWAMQGAETGIFVGAALLFLGIAVWATRRIAA